MIDDGILCIIMITAMLDEGMRMCYYDIDAFDGRCYDSRSLGFHRSLLAGTSVLSIAAAHIHLRRARLESTYRLMLKSQQHECKVSQCATKPHAARQLITAKSKHKRRRAAEQCWWRVHPGRNPPDAALQSRKALASARVGRPAEVLRLATLG